MRTTKAKPVSAAALRKKLFSAGAMLLVASIMLVSTSYAWLVLSTAPEITGISTQVGANGALEIVLLDTASYNDLNTIAEMDVDESLEGREPPVTVSNLQWGNLIDLGNEDYGLSAITLNPSRLAIQPFGEGHIISDVPLKTPIYNEDGRIIGLDKTSAISSVYENGKFPAAGENYGVRAIGVAADMNEGQLGVNTARTILTSSMATAKTTASNTLKAQGDALGNVAVGVALGSATGFTKADVTALRDLGAGLKSALGSIETALRQVYVGYLYTQSMEAEALAAALAEVQDPSVSLTTIKAKYSAVTMPAVSGGGDVVDMLVNDLATVQTAINSCEEKINNTTKDSFVPDEIISLMSPLVNYNDMTMGGYKMDELKNMVSGGQYDALFSIVSSGGLTVNVPTGSGILSDIADFAGNYTADVTVSGVSFGGFNNLTVTATMATATTVNPLYLVTCGNTLKGYGASVNEAGGGASVLTDFYGYAIDLAFRTNAEASDLMLQTESAQRIYDESQNEATQGGGSYMSFKSDAGLSATKMAKLMSGVRVVFMDHDKQVLAIAALDTQLGKNAYVTAAATYTAKSSVVVGDTTITPSADGSNYVGEINKTTYDGLADATVEDTVNTGKYVLGKDAYEPQGGAAMPEGKYAVLKYNNPQNSDYITEAEYNALPSGLTKMNYSVIANGGEESYAALLDANGAVTSTTIDQATYEALPATPTITVEADGTVKAKLYLYSFSMVESTAEHEDDTVTHYTGAIQLGNKLSSAAITALEENVPKQVTALVYLDGSVVNNSMVAANSSYSMTGVMNLQFASSAELVPMNNQALIDGEEDETPPANNENQQNEQPSGEDGEGGGAAPADGN